MVFIKIQTDVKRKYSWHSYEIFQTIYLILFAFLHLSSRKDVLNYFYNNNKDNIFRLLENLIVKCCPLGNPSSFFA